MSKWHEQGELRQLELSLTRIFVDWPWLDTIDSTGLDLTRLLLGRDTGRQDNVGVAVVFVADDFVPPLLLPPLLTTTASTTTPTAIMDFYDPDKGKKGSCDGSGNEFVQPGEKDTYVQLVISLALGSTAFIAFCVSPVETTQVPVAGPW